MDIQTEVSSQFGFNTVNFTTQSDISSNITNICTKNTTSERGKFVWLQNFQDDLLLPFFQNKIPQLQHQPDQLLTLPSQTK